MNISKLLTKYSVGAVWSIRGNDYDNLQWSEVNESAKPTLEQLQAWDAQYTADSLIENNISKAKSTRDAAIEAIIEYDGVEWDIDGSSRDRMDRAIDTAKRNNLEDQVRGWRLADNSVRSTTIADLEAVLDAYAFRMDTIFAQYIIWAQGDMQAAFEIN